MDLITPMIAGAAGALVRDVSAKGVEWLVALVAAHSSEVQEEVQRNANRFLVRLAKRVEALEAELPSAHEAVFQNALRHPGVSLLMQRALITAASTDNDDRHEVLSELIAQRLSAGADDLEALAGGAACDVVSALSSLHIRLLAVAATTLHLLPIEIPVPPSPGEAWEFAKSWWDQNLGRLCTAELKRVAPMDFRHLAGVSCVSLVVESGDLMKVFGRPMRLESNVRPTLPHLEQLSWWNTFTHLWDAGLKHSELTSVGTLIGIMYRDKTLGRRTNVRWEEKRPSTGV